LYNNNNNNNNNTATATAAAAASTTPNKKSSLDYFSFYLPPKQHYFLVPIGASFFWSRCGLFQFF